MYSLTTKCVHNDAVPLYSQQREIFFITEGFYSNDEEHF